MILSLVSVLAFVLCVGGAEEKKVQVTSLLLDPYTSLKTPGVYEGFVPDILEKIFDGADHFKISIVEDNKYGSKDDEGNWNGLIGKLQKEGTDLAAAPLTVTDQRKEAVAFTKPFMSFNFAALMTKAVQQNKSIKNFDDLAKHSDIKFGVLKFGSTQSFFKESQKKSYQKIYSEMEKNPAESYVSSTEEGVKKVRRAGESFALIMEGPTAKYIANKSPCDLVVVESQGEDVKYAFAVKKNDEKLLKKVNDKLEELGDMQSLRDKWWQQDCNSALKSVSSNFAIVFVVYLVRLLF